MGKVRQGSQLLVAGIAGLVLGASTFSASALLLYGGRGLLDSVGSLIALGLLSLAAGLWVGTPKGLAPGHLRVIGPWMFAVAALVVASFVATFWLRSPAAQTTRWGGPLAMVFLLAEPAYAIGAVLARLGVRRREGPSAGALGRSAGVAGVVVPALAGAAAGAMLAGAWLVPTFPPGPVFLGLALILTTAGSLEMGIPGDPEEATMSERVVLVTGVGSEGQVGHAIARRFAAQNARVVVVGRSAGIEERARALGSDVVGVAADLATADGAARAVAAARDRWGRLDVLVNVAGGLHVVKPVAETSPEEWESELDANATTAFLVSRAALPLLRESRGAIVNFASPAGERAVARMAAYSAGKSAVVALTRALAKEEKGTGVRVNAIAPGLLDTPQNRASMPDADRSDWVAVDEVVEVALYLSSPAASGINGETVSVLGRGV